MLREKTGSEALSQAFPINLIMTISVTDINYIDYIIPVEKLRLTEVK